MEADFRARDNEQVIARVLQVLTLLAVLYVFFCSIELMGGTFKLFGKGFADQLIRTTSNKIVGLFIGILATSLIQSSSSTTSIVVGLVAGGALTIENAIPIIMGANVGTSVTNTIVSLGHITRKEEFRRALAGATIHDFFNLLAVAVLLPLEILTGFLHKMAGFLQVQFANVGGMTLFNPLKTIVKPVTQFLESLLLETIGFSKVTAGIILLILALVLLFISLKKFVDIMKKVISGRVETVLQSVLFQSAWRSFLVGIALTAFVQSSSITTSLIVPLIGGGILTVEQFFPYTLGANIGTTVTAILAALVTQNPAAVTVAFAHLSFNVCGTAIFYPLRIIPITLAKKLGNVAAERRWVAIVYILVVFFAIPLGLILITR